MLDLILDTSTDPCFILIYEKKEEIARRLFPGKHNLSSTLLPTIQELTNNDPKKISRIFVGIGPGSYTGLRVAVSVATSLSLSLNIPLYPFCSLLAFIPPTIPNGPFGYLVPSVTSSLFLLQGTKNSDTISFNISQKFLEKEDIESELSTIPTLLSLEPEKTSKKILPYSHLIIQGAFYAPFLLSYLSYLAESPPSPTNIIYLHSP